MKFVGFFMEFYQFEYTKFATHLSGVYVTGHRFHTCMVEKGIILCDFLQLIYQRFSPRPGARPIKHISIEFEIRWKFKTL